MGKENGDQVIIKQPYQPVFIVIKALNYDFIN
jgi:hypothetical protein